MKYNKEVSRNRWRIIVWLPIFLGLIIFSVFNSTFFIPKESYHWTLIASIGGVLIGWGFGLAYARVYKIKGIDK